ncbi:hypothetical protein MCP1_30025 [Candidatus Terasakiella magnetica]|nr:hypothetical protein MCP1_30025 [Candidatus Terasakiella magnetica]
MSTRRSCQLSQQRHAISPVKTSEHGTIPVYPAIGLALGDASGHIPGSFSPPPGPGRNYHAATTGDIDR